MAEERDIKSILILLAVCLLLFFLLVGWASGIDTSSPTPTPTMKSISAQPSNASVVRTAYQGSEIDPFVVYWGETIDMTQVSGWDGKVMRIPGYEVVDVSTFTRKIYIDPSVFPEGMWYQWAPYTESHANTVAFRVRATPPVTTPVLAPVVVNKTSVFNSISIDIYNESRYRLPLRKTYDILVARGDGFNYKNPLIGQNTKVWIFGRVNGIYDYATPNFTLSVNATLINKLEEGEYNIVIVNKGETTVPKLVFNASQQQIRYEVPPPLDIYGYSPQVAYVKFKDWMTKYSDDTLNEINMTVEKPFLDIISVDEISLGADNTTRGLEIFGYTNVAPGSAGWVVWDEEKQNVKTIYQNTANATIFGTDAGAMREFHSVLQLNYDEASAGEHFITSHTTHGQKNRVQWWIYEDFEYNIHAPAKQKYSAGNLFISTPTPVEIVRTVVRTVTVIITVPPASTRALPTPISQPWYLQFPWSMILSAGGGILFCLIALWVLWKRDVI